MFSPPDPRFDALLRRALLRAGRIGTAVALVGLLVLLVFVLAGCGSDPASDSNPPADKSGSSSADSTQSASTTSADSTGSGMTSSSGGASASGSGGGSGGDDPGFFAKLASYTLSHPRREREMGTTCSGSADYSGRSMPFHEMVIDNGNGFNTTHESFQTSTPQAQTPYVAYATWDPCGLYLGLTGSAVGAGDCGEDDASCPLYDRPESPYRYWLVYLDTDPQGQSGSKQPKGDRPGPSELPFTADYLMEIRLDGVTVPVGDGYEYQGNAQLYERSSDWRVGLEESWQPMGRNALEIGDNSSSNFIEVALDLAAIGDPCTVQAIGWVADSQADEAFAFWPPPRGWKPPAQRGSSGAPQDSSDTQPDAQPDSVKQGTGMQASSGTNSAQGSGTDRADGAPANRSGSASSGSSGRSRTSLAEADSSGTRLRSVPIDSLQLDVYGFLLAADQKPNASANLNRTDFTMDRCQAQDGKPGE